VGYYGFLLGKFSRAKTLQSKPFSPPISIIIACRNEAENLKNNFPYILEQVYNDFEIVLINDGSKDRTKEVIEHFAKIHDNIKTLHLTSKGNKKKALTQGIAMAKNEYLLFTDADCKPTSKHWISEMVRGFSKSKNIVLGYGTYEYRKEFLNKLIRYETLLTAWQYFGYALNDIPYMGVGRNIAYTKTIFHHVNGFEKHEDIKSGDDDLFVNQIAKGENTACIWTIPSHTVSLPKITWGSWIQQKRRHITTASHYKNKHQFLLMLFFLSQFFFYILSVIWLLFFPLNWWILGLISIRFLVFYLHLIPVVKKLNTKDLVYLAPVLEFFLIGIQVYIGIRNLVGKPQKW
jgi:glycosyltransferase involved in cell wall biosynthesis